MLYDSSLAIERTKTLNTINKIGNCLEKVGIRPFKINVNKILQKAQTVSKYHYRDDDMLLGLQKLVHSLETDAQLNVFGQLAMKTLLQRNVIQRFQVEKHIASNAYIEQQSIEQPVFIIGMPRTGTTILHALLNRDSHYRSPLSWECLIPYPLPEKEQYHKNPQLALVEKEFDQLFKLVPDFKKKHYMEAISPQECIAITALNFNSYQFLAQCNLTSYYHWFANEANQFRNLQWHKKFLQYLQSNDTEPRRWLLKTPIHLMRLKTLFKVYPDAKIIMTHRHPANVVPSAASLVSSVRTMYSDLERHYDTGQEHLLLWSDYFKRFFNDRAELNKEEQIIDLHFDEFSSNQMMVVDKIYERFGWELSEDTRSSMLEFLAKEPQDKHGKHEYSLEQFGLSDSDIQKHYAEYINFLNTLRPLPK